MTIAAHNRPAETYELHPGSPIEIELAPCGIADITPFLQLTASQRHEGTIIERSTVICSQLDGEPDDRYHEIFARQIDTPEKFMRLLALLMGFASGNAVARDGGTGSFGLEVGRRAPARVYWSCSPAPSPRTLSQLTTWLQSWSICAGRQVGWPYSRRVGMTYGSLPSRPGVRWRRRFHDARGTKDRQSSPLSNFQRATAAYAFQRLYGESDSTRRFLVADETGLGKTHVAREVIVPNYRTPPGGRPCKTYRHRIRVLQRGYRCPEHPQAQHHGFGESKLCDSAEPADHNARDAETQSSARGGSRSTFVAFTPGTSFQLGHQMGRKEERAVLYALLRDHLGIRGPRATAALRIFQGGVSTWQKFRDWNVAGVDGASFRARNPPDIPEGIRTKPGTRVIWFR